MSLTSKQQYALDTLIKGDNVFLSGEGGTGKSYVIEQFTEYLEDKGIEYVVCAPTGLAALNVGGATLHRTFKLSIDLADPNVDLKNVEKAKVIIIDEISMCRRDIFQKIARALFDFENPLEEFDIKRERSICRKKQLVVVGDFFQLAPFLGPNDKQILEKVKNGELDKSFYKDVLNLNETIYPFQCEEWDKFNFKSVVLDEVVRQKDKEYVDNLNLVRKGDERGLKFIRKKSSKDEVEKAIYLTSKNKTADDLNKDNLKKIKGKEYTYYAEEEGIVADSEKPVSEAITLKVGARVMCVVNIQDKDKKTDEEDNLSSSGIVNGLCGTVINLTKDKVTVEFDNGQIHEFEKYKWSIKGFKKVTVKEGDETVEKTIMSEIGSYKQIPLKLAWAITIHKSQGQSYEAVNLDPACFAEGQLYVALSRAKNIEKLHLTKRLLNNYLKTSEVVKEFYKELEKEPYQEIQENIEVEDQVNSYQEVALTKEFAEEVEDNKIIEELSEIKEDEYISIKVPKSLENQVLRLIEGKVDNMVDSDEVDSLKRQIEDLKAQLEKLQISSKRRPKIAREIELKIIELRRGGLGMNKIAKEVGCGAGTVQRVLKENEI